MLFAGLLIGLIAGFAAGGRVDNLIAIRLRWPLVIFGALALRLGTEAALTRDVGIADSLRVPLLAAAYGVLAVGLWANRARPGMSLALVGITLNATAILANGGFMPVWEPSLTAAGFGRADVLSTINVILPASLDANFFRSAGPLGDVIPVPLPLLRNVLSIGDVILGAGLAFFLFAGLVRRPEEARPDGRTIHGLEPSQPVTLAGPAAGDLPGGVRAGTGLAASLVGVAALERPVILGGSGAGLASPMPRSSGGVTAPALPGALRGVAVRARHHPYVRLAVNGSFSALWTGQLISLLGDRVHQVALAALVYGTTNSAIAGALTFVAATLPNLLFGPLAGVLVDRWDQKRVLIVSDLLRAGIVLLIPAGVSVSVVLAYPLVFLLTTVSIFFRPARTAVIPRVVREDELVTANSVTWLSETLADVLGYPFAGLFVAFLGSALPLAFWLDSVSYVASALLVVVVVIPPVVRSVGSVDPVPGLAGIRDDLAAGWRFLRGEPVLLANTLQAVAGQLTIGATIAAVDLIRGISTLIGWSYLPVAGATGYLNTDFKGKGKRAVQALDDYDLVTVHIEAPDEAGHNGDAQSKIRALEQIDEHIVGPILEKLRRLDHWKILVMPDHPTPVAKRTHTSTPPPYCFAGSSVALNAAVSFTEINAENRGRHIANGYELMNLFING